MKRIAEGMVWWVVLWALWPGPARAGFTVESLDNDFPAEIAAAAEEGKHLVIFFHQLYCPYCDKMRARVHPDPKVDAYFSKNFVMIESNIRGDLEVVTPGGDQTTEKGFARKIRVRGTPTFIFFDKEGTLVLRVTGYLDVERFYLAGKYVVEQVYKQDKSFYRYVQEPNRLQ